jgi:molybdopterin-containing oxidoreductase family iron-sulfur binding subunit
LENEPTRRNFLKFAGLRRRAVRGLRWGALATGLHRGREEALKAKRWGMVIDTKKVGTKETIDVLAKACHATHNVPDIPGKQNVKWIWAAGFEEAFDQPNNFMDESLEKRQFALLCNHCTNAPCVRVCPTQATYKRPDGIVAMDYHRCIGCRYCMAGWCAQLQLHGAAQAPDSRRAEQRISPRMRGVVEKCNFCVNDCPRQAAPPASRSNGPVFGDLPMPTRGA